MAKALAPTPPGWYDDPYERGIQRYHSGAGWTDQTRPYERVPRAAVAVAVDRELPPSSAPLDVAVRQRWRIYWVLYVVGNTAVAVTGIALLPVIGVRAFLIVYYALGLAVIVALFRLGSALLSRHNAKFRP